MSNEAARLVPATFGELPVGAKCISKYSIHTKTERNNAYSDATLSRIVLQILPAEQSVSPDLCRRVLALLENCTICTGGSDCPGCDGDCKRAQAIAELEAVCNTPEPPAPPRMTAAEKLAVLETLTYCAEYEEPIPYSFTYVVKRFIVWLEEETANAALP